MDMIRIKTPSHQRHLTHGPLKHQPWTWELSMVGKLRIPQRTTILSIWGRSETSTLDFSPGWNFPLGRRTQTNLSVDQSIPAISTSRDEKEVGDGNVHSKKGGVSLHVCEVCAQVIPPEKDTPGPLTED